LRSKRPFFCFIRLSKYTPKSVKTCTKLVPGKKRLVLVQVWYKFSHEKAPSGGLRKGGFLVQVLDGFRAPGTSPARIWYKSGRPGRKEAVNPARRCSSCPCRRGCRRAGTARGGNWS